MRPAIPLIVSVGAWLFPLLVAAEPRQSPVQVALHNDGLAPPDVVSRAQAEVTRLYALIGVEVVWRPPTTDDAAVRMVKLTTWEPRNDRIPVMALGATYRAESPVDARAYVFWLRVQHYAQQFTIGIDMLLGAAIAHELGHILFPSGSHASRGLMRATWDREQFRLVANGLLHFSPQSAAQIRGSVNSASASSRRPRSRSPATPSVPAHKLAQEAVS